MVGSDDLRRAATAAFGERLDGIAEQPLADHLIQTIPELEDDPQTRTAWIASNRSNVAAWLRLLGSGEPAADAEPPADATEVAESYILSGAALPTLLRVYRVGHAFVFEEWIAHHARARIPA